MTLEFVLAQLCHFGSKSYLNALNWYRCNSLRNRKYELVDDSWYRQCHQSFPFCHSLNQIANNTTVAIKSPSNPP